MCAFPHAGNPVKQEARTCSSDERRSVRNQELNSEHVMGGEMVVLRLFQFPRGPADLTCQRLTLQRSLMQVQSITPCQQQYGPDTLAP
jgi:hypothetical protein